MTVVTIFDPTTGANVPMTKALLEGILGSGAEAGNPKNTALTTDGAGSLTAAALIGGIVSRSGVTAAAFTDTTVTATALLAALGGATVVSVGSTAWLVQIRNATAFTETVAGGSGITASGTVVIPPLSVGTFLLTYSATTPAFTLYGIGVAPLTTSLPLASTTLATNGAGTITAAGIAGGVTTRTTVAANFTDTTATGAQLAAALPNIAVGQSFIYRYVNNSTATATIAAGASGMTVSGIAAVPPKCEAEFLVTCTAADTFTMVGISRTTPNTTSGTFTANGATPVTVTNVNVTASSAIIITLKTVGGTVAPSAPPVLTITPGTGFTVGGTASDTSVYNYLIIN